NYSGLSPIGSWGGSSYSGVVGMLASGRNGGLWNGSGIVTSMSAAMYPQVLTTLGVDEASDALNLLPGQTQLWDGQVVDDTTVLVKYTYGGDTDLSGTIDGDDYFAIDGHVGMNGLAFGFMNGDFNFDGAID